MSVFLAVLMAWSLSACSLFRSGSDEEGEGQAPAGEGEPVGMVDDPRVFLGTITMVNEKSGFVLINTPTNQRLEPGIPLQSFGEAGMSAELLFSPEQTFGFMTADIREGTPMVGDEVFLRYTEDFGDSMSPRMQAAMEKFEYEQSLGFFERRRYQREQRRLAKEKAKAREEREP